MTTWKNKMKFNDEIRRQAGQSVDEELFEYYSEHVDLYVAYILLAIVLILYSFITGSSCALNVIINSV